VMIRGIPKEGWKHSGPPAGGPECSRVMIRGIPKEGWKHVAVAFLPACVLLCDDQRNP
jgi:hypothetical protein